MNKKETLHLARKIKKILGKGWSFEVWKNLGWHVSWRNGAIILNYSSYDLARKTGRHFWAQVSAHPDFSGGHPDLTPTHCYHYKDPINAVKSGCRYAQAVFDTMWKPTIESVTNIKNE